MDIVQALANWVRRIVLKLLRDDKVLYLLNFKQLLTVTYAAKSAAHRTYAAVEPVNAYII